MKRTAIAAAWIVGSTLPLLAAVVFLVGCCALPFHGVIHRMMPLCHMAAELIAGHGQHDDHPATPAKQKDEPVKRIATETAETFHLVAAMIEHEGVSEAAASYRSFISLGATRCDQDVGVNVFVQTFRI